MSQPPRSLRSRGDPVPTAGTKWTAASGVDVPAARITGRPGLQPPASEAFSEPDSWWDNPGRPTPYILWGLLWCICGTAMVPLDRRVGGSGTGRFYRCDAGCGRRPIPAPGLETEVFRLVVEAAVGHFPGWTREGWRTRRIARAQGRFDRRRDLIRSWLHRVTAGGGQQPHLHWQSFVEATP